MNEEIVPYLAALGNPLVGKYLLLFHLSILALLPSLNIHLKNQNVRKIYANEWDVVVHRNSQIQARISINENLYLKLFQLIPKVVHLRFKIGQLSKKSDQFTCIEVHIQNDHPFQKVGAILHRFFILLLLCEKRTHNSIFFSELQTQKTLIIEV